MSQEPQPILTYIDGVSESRRYLTAEEIKELTSSGAGKGDWFAQWLAATPEAKRSLSLRDLLTKTAPPDSYQTFAIADGISIVYDHHNPNNPLNSVSRHLRFITVVLPDSGGSFDISQAILKRTLCIVGSAYPDGTSAFLQCTSWDPDALGKKMGMMRFYERSDKGWEYFGNGFNAFNPPTEDRMPFCGHVGGALIMKELTVPWTHWFDKNNVNEFIASLGSTKDTPSLCDPYNALYDPLFTPKNETVFSLLGRAEDFETVVETSVSKWYFSRWTHDFLDSAKKPLETITTVIKQWVGQILLNRSMNIAASATSSAQVQAASEINGIPTTLFCNIKALTLHGLLPSVAPPNSFTVSNSKYVSKLAELELSLFYDDFSTNPPTRKLAVKNCEGPFAFPVIEPGIEDVQAIGTLLHCSSKATLMPPKAIAALLMVDFYNPVYSARRMSLMKYVPESAQFNPDTKTYNVIDQFTANVLASSEASDPASPEYEVLKLLATRDDKYTAEFTDRVNNYLQSVASRFTTDLDAAINDYMCLAEGRRRLFKGFEESKPDKIGLDEFRLTLPIATKPVPFVLKNMKETGVVEEMPEHEAVIVKGPLHGPFTMPAGHPTIGRGGASSSCPAQREWVRRALA